MQWRGAAPGPLQAEALQGRELRDEGAGICTATAGSAEKQRLGWHFLGCQVMSNYFLWLSLLSNCFLQLCCSIYQLETATRSRGCHPLLPGAGGSQAQHRAAVLGSCLLWGGGAAGRGAVCRPCAPRHPDPRAPRAPQEPAAPSPHPCAASWKGSWHFVGPEGGKSHSFSANFLIQCNLFVSKLRTA